MKGTYLCSVRNMMAKTRPDAASITKHIKYTPYALTQSNEELSLSLLRCTLLFSSTPLLYLLPTGLFSKWQPGCSAIRQSRYFAADAVMLLS